MTKAKAPKQPAKPAPKAPSKPVGMAAMGRLMNAKVVTPPKSKG